MIIDIHAHAFPDPIAARAVPALARAAGIAAALDGTLSDLVTSMDQAGVDRSVVASIATKPEQFAAILSWSQQIASDRIVPFPSIHPADRDAVAHVYTALERGFRGVKLHPYYQEFELDEPRLDPLYAALEQTGLIVLCHTGFDVAFPRERRCDPVRIRRVLERFPDLRFVATHLGAWDDWDEVRAHLIGHPIYIDTAFSVDLLGAPRARELILAHPPEYVLFGSDAPWAAQQACVAQIRGLNLGVERERLVLGENARRLLGAASAPARATKA